MAQTPIKVYVVVEKIYTVEDTGLYPTTCERAVSLAREEFPNSRNMWTDGGAGFNSAGGE